MDQWYPDSSPSKNAAMPKKSIPVLNESQEEKNQSQATKLSLAKRIAFTTNQAYPLSKTKKWLRRLLVVLSTLLATAALIALIGIITNPFTGPLSIAAIGLAAFSAFTSIFQTVGLYHGTMKETINAGSFHFTVNSERPYTLMSVINLIFFPIMLGRKMSARFTNPPKEAAARQTQTATIFGLFQEVARKTKNHPNEVIKEFLSDLLNKTKEMYHTGTKARLEENHESYTTKAKCILQKVAEIVEHENFATIENVGSLLQHAGKGGHRLGQIINANRNWKIRFWQKPCTSMTTALAEKHGIEKTDACWGESVRVHMLNTAVSA